MTGEQRASVVRARLCHYRRVVVAPAPTETAPQPTANRRNVPMTIKAQVTVASAERIGTQEVIYAATGPDPAIPDDTSGATVPGSLQFSLTLTDPDAHGTIAPGAVLNIVISEVSVPGAPPVDTPPAPPAVDTTKVTGDLSTPPATAPPAGDGQSAPNLPAGTPDPASQTSDTPAPGPADFPPATPAAGGGLSEDETQTATSS